MGDTLTDPVTGPATGTATVPALRLLHRADLDRFDATLRTGIAAALRYDCDGATVDDVLDDVASGRAGVYADGDPLAGFVVCRIANPASATHRALLVWLAWHGRHGGHRGARSAVLDYWPAVMALAADLDCRRIEVASSRPYARLQPALRPAYTVFHAEVR